MLYIIRDVLILHWGRAAKNVDESTIDATAGPAPYIDLHLVWPLDVIEPEKVSLRVNTTPTYHS